MTVLLINPQKGATNYFSTITRKVPRNKNFTSIDESRFSAAAIRVSMFKAEPNPVTHNTSLTATLGDHLELYRRFHFI